jgi:3-deoxy-manno-octulosonate cytidylyltransferase (CMP-KDO synthetase)
MSFVAIIPARFASSRLPGKPLADINGKPMVVRVMERAQQSGASRVIVATDHPGVVDVIKQAGGEVCMTRADHHSGTERLAEVIDHYHFDDEQIVVNVQGDEPLIPPVIIRQVAENLAQCRAGMATLAVPIHTADEAFNPNAVKVVMDAQSRDLIGDTFLRHIGIYAYRAGFIRRYIRWQPSQLEKIEMLEQLRVLWYGEKIHVAVAQEVPGIGVDTQEELNRVRQLLLQGAQ